MRRQLVALIAGAVLLVQPTLAGAQQGWAGESWTFSATGTAIGPRVGMDAHGTATAVWLHCSTGSQCGVVVARRFGTGTWAAPTAVTPMGDYGPPLLVVDPFGNATVLWKKGGSLLQAVRYSATAGTWTDPTTLSLNATEPQVGTDDSGNVVVIWLFGSTTLTRMVQATRYSAATGTWGTPSNLSADPAANPRLAVDPDGNAVAVWGTPFGSPIPILAARYTASTGAWTSAAAVSSPDLYAFRPSVGFDHAGNAIVIWATGTIGIDARVMAARMDSATGTWSTPALVAYFAGTDGLLPAIIVDPAGNAMALWTEYHSRLGAYRLQAVRFTVATGSWGDKVNVADADPDLQLAGDDAGNVFAAWTRVVGTVNPYPQAEAVRFNAVQGTWEIVRPLSSRPLTPCCADIAATGAGTATVVWVASLGSVSAVQTTSWLATPLAPAIAAVTPRASTLAVAFTAPLTSAPFFAPVNYAYSLDDGATWLNRTPASTSSPLEVAGLMDGVAYAVRLRAVNAAGPGAASPRVLARPGTGPTFPTGLTASSIAGNAVTLTWNAPAAGLVPTGYVLEGGINPGEVLASIPTGSTGPTFSFVAPAGAFYVRIHALAGSLRSVASNEIRIFVNVPAPPSAPTNLLGLVNGSSIALSWTNTFAGGAPTSLWLNVTGAIATTLPLPMGETFTYANVPPGTYTLSVIAANASGVSAPSNAVTLTFPDTCTGVPGAPTNLQTWKVGSTIFLVWGPPAGGTAVTSYTVWVGGAYVGSFTVPGRTLSGAAAPGSYELSVTANNVCGVGPAAPAQTIVIP